MNPDEAIERAVNEIHRYFIGGAGSVSESIVCSEKEVIRKALRRVLTTISHADLRAWSSEEAT